MTYTHSSPLHSSHPISHPLLINVLYESYQDNLVLSSHDISSGGLIVSLAEMSISSGFGLKIFKPKKLINYYEYLFGEDQGRYLIEISKDNFNKVQNFLKKNSIFFEIVANVQNDTFQMEEIFKLSVKDLIKINNEWYNKFNALN